MGWGGVGLRLGLRLRVAVGGGGWRFGVGRGEGGGSEGGRAPFEARASLMKSTHASKCVAMSEAASERSLIGQRMYLRWDEPSKKLETSSVALRMCVTSRVVSLSMSLAVTRSPRKRKPGRISPFHESSRLTPRTLAGLAPISKLRLWMRGLRRNDATR